MLDNYYNKGDILFIEIEIEKIKLNPFQPRSAMDSEKLEEITASIREIGIIQPLIVREQDEGSYQLIAGERRYRGAIKAGLKKVPAVVRQVTDEEMLQFALIENLHREEMSPIDKAMGFKDLIEKFNITQKRISEIFRLSRPAVANTLRLLELEDEIKEALNYKHISEGHARALLAIKDKRQRLFALNRIVHSAMSVRESEDLTRRMNKSNLNLEIQQKNSLTIYEQRLIEDLRITLGTKVSLLKDNGCGKIEIEFYSNEDLDRIIEILSRLN